MTALTEEEIRGKILKLNDWNYQDKKIFKDHKFKNFTEALCFTVKIGIEAEKMNHHPDILIYSWNKVKITLYTHTENSVTDNDFKLAAIIDKLL